MTKSSVTEQGRERHESEHPLFDIQKFVKSIQTQKIHVIMFVVC